MQPPVWLAYLQRSFADLYAVRPGEAQAAQVNMRHSVLISLKLESMLPRSVFDVPIEGAHDVIGDRAFD